MLSILLARRHLNTVLLTNFENSNSISNIFLETHDFLVLAEPLIISIYLRTTVRHFRDQGNVRHPTSKLLKCDFAQTLNTFWNHFLPIVAADKASLVLTEPLLFGDTFFNQFGNNIIRNATFRFAVLSKRFDGTYSILTKVRENRQQAIWFTSFKLFFIFFPLDSLTHLDLVV